MIGIPKVMIFFFIILSTIMFWTTSNVCRYNFVIEKRTNQLNILAAEIDPSIPMARVFYFKELIILEIWPCILWRILLDDTFRHSRRCEVTSENALIVSTPAILD